jgi:hypothetical protein
VPVNKEQIGKEKKTEITFFLLSNINVTSVNQMEIRVITKEKD